MAYTFKHGDRPIEGYTIQRAVGRGGFGEVYYSVSDGGREVAIKYLRDNPQIELRGVSNCINLKSPYLVSIFDVKKTTDGEYAIIMEYCSGPSLRDLLIAEPQGFTPEKAAFFLREIGKGLSYLHDRGIVHRDLKPGNIFFDDGYVKIGDYGLSKFISVSRHSGQTASVGTVHYMAPEIGSGNYSRGVDIYALGVILFEMLLGKVPFEGSSMAEVLMKHLTTQPELDQLPQPFGSIIRKALEKDPNDRYQNVDEMVEAVLEVDAVRNSLAGFSAKSLEGAARLGAPDRAASPMPSPNPPPGLGQQAPPPQGPLPYAQPIGSNVALPNRLQKKMDRISRKMEAKVAKLEGRRPRPTPPAAKTPSPPAVVHRMDEGAIAHGARRKRIVLCGLLSLGLAIGLGLLIGNAQGSEEYGLAAGLLTVLMSGGILLARRLIGWFSVTDGPRWSQQLITLCACAPFVAMGSAPAMDRYDEEGVALFLGLLVVALFHKHDKDRESSGEISFGCAFWSAVWGMICVAIWSGILNADAENVIWIGAGVAGAVSLIVQSTAWWRPVAKGPHTPEGPPSGGEGDGERHQADAGTPIGEGQGFTADSPAISGGSGHAGDMTSSAMQHVRLRWGTTRAFWGLMTFLLTGGAIVGFLVPLVAENMHYHDVTGSIIACTGFFAFMLFALRKTTPFKREGFWRESARPFLLSLMLFGIGGTITGIAREWGHYSQCSWQDHATQCLGDEGRIALIAGLVMCSLALLFLFFFTGGKPRRSQPFVLDGEDDGDSPGSGSLPMGDRPIAERPAGTPSIENRFDFAAPAGAMSAALPAHRGVAVLVLGILGINVFPIGIAAWIMGRQDLTEMDAGRMDPAGRGLTSAGATCGIISVVIAVIGTLIGLVLLAGASAGAFH